MEYKVVETFPVRDGVVKADEKVWWLGESGPEFVLAGKEFRNIVDYPDCYQVAKPVFVKHPTVDWLVIYEHEEGYKQARHPRKTKHQRKKPEFTFQEGVYIGQDCGPYAGYLFLTMERPDVFTKQQQIGATMEYLAATSWQSDYSFKPLRKKLKLYIKWLQSESSLVQS